MHFLRSILLVFLIAFTAHSKASESASQDRMTGDRVAVTTEDIVAIKGLIKKGFALQGRLLGNEVAALSTLKTQINRLEESLDAINLNHSITVNHLHLIGGLVCVLLIAQFLGIWQIRRYRDNMIKTIASEISANACCYKANVANSSLTSLIESISTQTDEALRERSINSDALMGSGAYVSKIEIQKATPLLVATHAQAAENMSNQNSLDSEMRTLSSDVEKIKAWGLEKACHQHSELHIPPRKTPPSTKLRMKIK